MENKSWKDDNTLKSLREKVIQYATENKADDMEAIEYISESLNVDLDNAYNLLLESRGKKPLSDEEIDHIYDEASKVIPIANIPDVDGMVVVPASWRD